MVLGLYGILYLDVARRPAHGWLVAAVALAGKILGPLGLAWLILTGTWPPDTVILVVTNDLIWWIPFACYLRDAWPAFRTADRVRPAGLGSDVCDEGTSRVPPSERTQTVKYMILTFASQQQYQEMVGQPSGGPAWTQEDWAALGAFMQAFSQELLDSGELVETRGLSAPVHTRRVQLKAGVPVVTDGPYAEAEEVLAGYWVVDCATFDRATEIASRLTGCPGPEHLRARAYADVRPIDEHQPDFEG